MKVPVYQVIRYHIHDQGYPSDANPLLEAAFWVRDTHGNDVTSYGLALPRREEGACSHNVSRDEEAESIIH